jgi:hypothetical protein
MNRSTATQARLRALSAIVTLATGIAALPAQAQNFEAFYGEANSRDRGEDVKSVRHCPRGGSIIVGTRSLGFIGSEALVTRVDDFGVELWQQSYRVGDFDFSSAYGVVEYRDGSGFAITGSASRSDTRIYAMRISCEGKPEWSVLLSNQDSGHRGNGYDIIELPGTSATIGQGDLIVIGDERLPVAGGTTHGRVARIDPLGNVIFDNAYLQQNSIPGLRFRAVTLARAATGLMTDLVIAGSAGGDYPNWDFDRRGLMFRVSINGVVGCNALLGSNDSPSQDYFGVTQVMPAGFFNSHTILVGATTPGPAGVSQTGYITRFSPGSCSPLMQSHWPFLSESAEALDVVEFPSTIAGAPPRFAVTGSVRGALNTSDGFVAWANVGSLAPFIPTQRFGTQQSGVEALRAMDVKGNRLVLAGNTDRDWEMSGDPRDAYLVQTDPTLLRTQCSLPWTILTSNPNLPSESFEAKVIPLGPETRVETEGRSRSGAGFCCALDRG